MMTNDEILDLLSTAVKAGSGVRLAVSGKSMGPLYAGVSEIEVVPCETANIKLGSLVVFERKGHWCVHRVVRRWRSVGGGLYLTKGDGLARPDSPAVASSEIRGLVSSLCRNDGSRVDLLSLKSRVQSLWIVIRYWIGRVILPSGKGPEPEHRE